MIKTLVEWWTGHREVFSELHRLMVWCLFYGVVFLGMALAYWLVV